MTSEILVKGMVCERCIAVIKEGLKTLGHQVIRISLGKVSLGAEVNKEEFAKLEDFLGQNGFELISNRQIRIVNQAKEYINEVLSQRTRHDARPRFSTLLADKLSLNYDSISELFTQVVGMTLERYIIEKRLEKVKELLVYTDCTLTEIAYISGFSSINHLSRQFKEHTGLPPSRFKRIKAEKQILSGKIPEHLPQPENHVNPRGKCIKL